ncbi:MAG: hypothetical protein RR619_00310, partial [Raoultibacter sp.]
NPADKANDGSKNNNQCACCQETPCVSSLIALLERTCWVYPILLRISVERRWAGRLSSAVL